MLVSSLSVHDSENWNTLQLDHIIFDNCFLALVIMGQSRPWSDRYLFSAFNAFKFHRTNNLETS